MIKIKKKLASIIMFGFMCSSHLTWANEGLYKNERNTFVKAQKAYQKKDMDVYQKMRTSLDKYPLVGYLDYQILKDKFHQLPKQEIKDYLKKYKGSYIATRLQGQWLSYLGSKENWVLYKDFYRSKFDNNTHTCYNLRRQIATHKITSKKQIYNKIKKIWLQSGSLPNACNPLFAEWKKNGQQTEDVTWQRFQLAYAARNNSIIQYLYKQLNSTHQALADKLIEPKQHANFWFAYLKSNEYKTTLKAHSIKRLLQRLIATHNVEVSRLLVDNTLPLTSNQRDELKKLSIWYFAKYSAGNALVWLEKFHPPSFSEGLKESHLRYALQAKRWKTYQKAYAQASSVLKKKPEWRYWYAYAIEQTHTKVTNPKDKPKNIYKALAVSKSFYGLLAADKAGISNALYHHRSATPKNIENYRVPSVLSPAFEWFYLGQTSKANREWYANHRKVAKKDWPYIAKLTYEDGWFAGSIRAHAKAKLWQATNERFPLPYKDYFQENATLHGVHASWLFAMARQESAFDHKATSHVGARGILQLMPATAKRVAKSLSIPYSKAKLYSPDYSIQLGSKYIKDMLDRFDNNYILATAAYNAGPHRVNEWIRLRPIGSDWVHWAATIPYKETRNYVQNILSYSLVYQSLINDHKKPVSLDQFAPNRIK
jgi:soluble lytic murein transglycosylase